MERFAFEFRLEYFSDVDQFLQIDSGSESAAFAKKDQIFEYDVARRAGRERAAAESGQRRVENPDARLKRRVRVGQAGSPGIVQVHDQRGVADSGQNRSAHFGNLHRAGVSDRVGHSDRLGARVKAGFYQFNDGIDRDLARNRASERH